MAHDVRYQNTEKKDLSAWPETVAKKAVESGIDIRRITTLAPWNLSEANEKFGNDMRNHKLYLLFLVKLKSMTTWESLPFVAEKSWSQCYESVYVLYFRRIQSLITMHPAIAAFDDQFSSMADSSLSMYMMRHEFLLNAGS